MAARRIVEWRRVARWPNGTVVPGMAYRNEAQARDDFNYVTGLPDPLGDGVEYTLERRSVTAWEVVERITVAPAPVAAPPVRRRRRNGPDKAARGSAAAAPAGPRRRRGRAGA